MKAARLHSFEEDHLHLDQVPEPDLRDPVDTVVDFVGEHGTTDDGPAMLAQDGRYFVGQRAASERLEDRPAEQREHRGRIDHEYRGPRGTEPVAAPTIANESAGAAVQSWTAGL